MPVKEREPAVTGAPSPQSDVEAPRPEPSGDAPSPSSSVGNARKDIYTSAILAGLCALSPIPFIDDLFIGALRRRMMRRLFRGHGLTLTWRQQRALTRGHGCLLLGCLAAVVVYPVKKIFRKLLYVLAVKEAVDVASRLLHQGVLVEHALRRQWITTELLEQDPSLLPRLNVAIHEACEELGTSPVNQILRRSFVGGRGVLRGLGRQILRLLRATHFLRQADAIEELPEPGETGGGRDLFGDLRASLQGEGAYFVVLQGRLEDCWLTTEPGNEE